MDVAQQQGQPGQLEDWLDGGLERARATGRGTGQGQVCRCGDWAGRGAGWGAGILDGRLDRGGSAGAGTGTGGDQCLDRGWRGEANRRKTWTGRVLSLDGALFLERRLDRGGGLPTAKPVTGGGLERASGENLERILDGGWNGMADPGSDPIISVQ